MTTTNRNAAMLKRTTLLIAGLLFLTGCAKQTTTTITSKNTTPDKIEYNINQDRFTALEFSQWVVDTEPTVEEMEYFIDNRMTAYEASKVIEAANKGMTAEDYIKSNT